MNFRDYSIHIIAISGLFWALCYSVFRNTRDDLITFGGMTTLVYLMFCSGIFLYAQRISSNQSNYTFNGVVTASFLIKLVMSIALLAYWQRYKNPPDNHHVIMYIIAYVVYTIYEVYFLTLLAKKTNLK